VAGADGVRVADPSVAPMNGQLAAAIAHQGISSAADRLRLRRMHRARAARTGAADRPVTAGRRHVAAVRTASTTTTLTRMAQGASPDVEGFGKMVQWLGVSADDFIARPKARGAKKPDETSEDLLVVVSRHLRASKTLDPRSAKALEGLSRPRTSR
jgi:hypothetical protein